MDAIKKYKLEDSMARDAVRSIFTQIRRLTSVKDEVIIALSGGSSLNTVYEMMAKHATILSADDWKKIRFCFADERLVPPYDERSNHMVVYEHLFSSLFTIGLIHASQISLVPFDKSHPHKEYTRKITHVDMLLLGVGGDGHIASLFPNHPLLDSRRYGYLYIDDAPKSPPERITLSPLQISSAYVAYAFFVGEEKSGALRQYQDPHVTLKDCPVKLVDAAGQREVYTCRERKQ